jgi:predicted dienelactone hydrolase
MFTVGHTRVALHDRSRRNWSNTGPRPLVSELWYPGADDAQARELAFGGTEPLFRLAPVARDAAWHAHANDLPLVLLSHGTGGSALQMGWLARHLCMHGYVCAAVNHHGNNSLEPYLPQGFLLWWERAVDLSALLDALLSHEDLAGRIDAGRVGAAGFSLGGYTVIALAGGRASLDAFEAFCCGPDRDITCEGPREFPQALEMWPEILANDALARASFDRHQDSFKDARMRAVFALNPALAGAFSDTGLSHVDVPVHIVACQGDTVVPANSNAKSYAARIASAELTLLEGPLDHYVFLSEATDAGRRLAPVECADAPGIARASIHARVAGMAQRFFQRHLEARP